MGGLLCSIISGMICIGAIQVFFATIGGVWAYSKSGFLQKSLIIYMGISIFISSLIGSYLSHLMPEKGMNFIYGILALIAVVLMPIPKKGLDDIEGEKVTFNKWLASFLAFVIGVGAGGCYLCVHFQIAIYTDTAGGNYSLI